jgi:hypothetical protein
VIKLFLILILGGALADGLAPKQPPPLLIDSPQSTLDGAR